MLNGTASTVYIYRTPENSECDKQLIEIPDILSLFYDETVVHTKTLSERISEKDIQQLGITECMLIDSHYLVLDSCGTKNEKLVYAIREKSSECVLKRLDTVLDEISSSKNHVEKVLNGYTLMDYESGHLGEKIPTNILTKEDKDKLMSARVSMQAALGCLTKIIVDVLEE